MLKLITSSFIILICVSGCATIKRDIYFKDLASTQKKNATDSFPGISNYKDMELTGEKERSLRMEVQNKADGHYVFGIIIPIIPVFFLSENKFELDKDEDLKVVCDFNYKWGKEPTFKWMMEEVKKNGKDRCLTASLILPDGTELKPTKVTDVERKIFGHPVPPNAEFTFPVKAHQVDRFKIKDITVKLNDGKIVKLKTEVEMEKVDWMRYHTPPIAP